MCIPVVAKRLATVARIPSSTWPVGLIYFHKSASTNKNHLNLYLFFKLNRKIYITVVSDGSFHRDKTRRDNTKVITRIQESWVRWKWHGVTGNDWRVFAGGSVQFKAVLFQKSNHGFIRIPCNMTSINVGTVIKDFDQSGTRADHVTTTDFVHSPVHSNILSRVNKNLLKLFHISKYIEPPNSDNKQ